MPDNFELQKLAELKRKLENQDITLVSLSKAEIHELRHLLRNEIGRIISKNVIYGDEQDNEYVKNTFENILEKISK